MIEARGAIEVDVTRERVAHVTARLDVDLVRRIVGNAHLRLELQRARATIVVVFHLLEVAISFRMESIRDRLPRDLLVAEPHATGHGNDRILGDQCEDFLHRHLCPGIDAFIPENLQDAAACNSIDFATVPAAESGRVIVHAFEIQCLQAFQAAVGTARFDIEGEFGSGSRGGGRQRRGCEGAGGCGE